METLLSAYTPSAGIIPAYVSSAYQWIAVRQRFDQFHDRVPAPDFSPGEQVSTRVNRSLI
jgi:hypothetical protein